MQYVGEMGVVACYLAAVKGLFPEIALQRVGAAKYKPQERWEMMLDSYEPLKEIGLKNSDQAKLWGVDSSDFNTFKSRAARKMKEGVIAIEGSSNRQSNNAL